MFHVSSFVFIFGFSKSDEMESFEIKPEVILMDDIVIFKRRKFIFQVD